VVLEIFSRATLRGRFKPVFPLYSTIFLSGPLWLLPGHCSPEDILAVFSGYGCTEGHMTFVTDSGG